MLVFFKADAITQLYFTSYFHSGLEYSDDIAKNRAIFGIFEIAYWAFLWLKLNSGQHLTQPFLSLFYI